MPNFQNPVAFLLLLLIPLLYLMRKLNFFKIITFPAVLGDWEGKMFLWKGKVHKFISILAKIFIIAAFCCSVIAFADPVMLQQEKVYTTLGTDIVFVLDTSPSMAAQDVDGLRRIDAAKNSIASLAQSYNGNRYGIVIFGSNASVVVPPTSDNDYFTGSLGTIKLGEMGNGSAIGDGLSTAICHLASSKASNKCVILLTDGENNAGEIHPETAAKLAVNNNIALYVVGVGSKGNVPIEYTDPVSGKQYSGYLNSDYNYSSLRKLAALGNGRFFEVQTIGDLKSALDSVSKAEETTQEFIYKTKNIPYYKKFVVAAIILILAAWFIKRILLKEYICFKYRKILFVRSIFLVATFIMLLLAYSGISWGTYLVPVQKNSCAVSMVFDISNSMMAEDCTNGMSRLKAASIYAKKLLAKMEGIPTSVVLAKGDGMASIPLTEDTAIIESLLDVMSPAMMTAPGSSLGKGIIAAAKTFPDNVSAAGQIWLFTDGEETDKQLSAALSECIQAGISVTIIGFGSESESGIVAGDGKTVVNTALRAGNIEKVIEGVLEKYSFYKKHANISYIDSTTKGSATILLQQLDNYNSENLITAYETKPVPRYRLFIILSIIMFALSFVVTEFDFMNLFNSQSNVKKSHFSSLCIFCTFCVFTLFFSGCSSKTNDILAGTYSWHKKQYKHSISKFMNVAQIAEEENDKETLDYSLYDLGTAYLMVGENDAAMERFTSISDDAHNDVKYSAFYNAGIISYNRGDYDEAKEYFKKALKVDNSKIDAKINLELSAQMSSAKGRQREKKSIQAQNNKNENPDIEDAVFEHIKENDKKQWKNSESTEPQDLSNDY